MNQSVQYVPCPKHGDGAGVTFSQDGSLLAVILKNTEESAEQVIAGEGSGDVIGLFDSTRSEGEWDCLHRFSIGSRDTADLKFSRDGAHLIVWDSPLQCSIQILQIQFGVRLVRYVRQVAQITPYPSGSALGVSKLVLSPNLQYILAGFHDEKLRMINSLSWRELYAYDHSWQ